MANRGDYGSYLPTTQTWDVTELYQTEVTSPEFKELLIRMYQNFNSQAMAVNAKDTGLYDQSEFVNGQTFFPDPSLNSTTDSKPTQRQVFRKVLNFGALPKNALKTMAHGISITNGVSFTRIYGSSTDPVNHSYVPLPFASCTAVVDNIEFYADGTNVTVVTKIDWSMYTKTYIVLEYLKS